MKRLFPTLPERASLGDVYRAFPAKLGPLALYQDQVMRADSDLSVAEREMIAAYVSALNACAYCYGSHQVHAKAFGVDIAVIEAMVEDLSTSPVEDRLKPVLRYTGKLTTAPSKMTETDVQDVYDAGWSEAALFDAIQVCGLFNLMNRFLEGTGITAYKADPRSVGEDVLAAFRSPSAYENFGKSNGVM